MLKAKYAWDVAFPEVVPDGEIFDHILKNRGIDDVDRFFSMGKESLHDPFLFEDMRKAVSRIFQAVSAREKILVYGDYDCDGISAIAVLYRTLRSLGADVAYDLPDRFSDGYGLNLRAVEEIIRAGVRLVITVDNGITCPEEIARLSQAGIDTIVTDHHEPMGELPKAFAILHAKLSSAYPFKELAGVGVSYKLAAALAGNDLEDLLDLVMIGTVADLVLLDGENQAIVNLGLDRLKKTQNPGLKKLVQYSHLEETNLTAIAFKIAPKINSSGRLGKAKDAVRLLVSDSEEEVGSLILEIEAHHAERKDLTDDAYAKCERLVRDEDRVLVIAAPDLHEGVIGICAQKIAEKYQKSTCIICTGEDALGKGSMRSYGEDNILAFLKGSADLLVRYGGHSQAAGLAIEIANIPAFRERLNRLAVPQGRPSLSVDMKVSVSGVSPATIRRLEHFSFFTARFLFSDLEVLAKTVMTGKHTKLLVSDGIRTVEAIAFNNLECFHGLEPGDRVDIVGGLSLNSWRNRETVQILIKDVACGHFQVLDLRNAGAFEEALPDLRHSPETLVLDEEIPWEEFDLPSLVTQKRPATVAVASQKRLPLCERLLKKETIGSVYRLLARPGGATLSVLETDSRTPRWALSPLLRIFAELGLVAVDGDRYTALESAEKRNLADSPTYRRLIEANRQASFLANESTQTIHAYFTNLMEAQTL